MGGKGSGRRPTHGWYGTPTYRSWLCMIQRCTNPKSTGYRYYGGRGITVCKRWRKFLNFFVDMGVRPPGKTLDRIKNHLGYRPSNCRWATRHEQRINRTKP